MTLRLTPKIIAAAYEFLSRTPPFDRWDMPPVDALDFAVTQSINERGHHIQSGARYEIGVSEACSGHTINMLMTTAHEMVHFHQAYHKLPGRRSEHGAEFKRLAAEVCRHHGFDVKAF